MDRNTYKEKAKENIDLFFAKIDELEAKREHVKDEIRGHYQLKMAELKAQKTELELKYKDLVNATEETWEEAKEDFASSANYFQDGVTKLGSLVN